MRRRWLAGIAILVLLAIVGAGIWLVGAETNASPLASQATHSQTRITATAPGPTVVAPTATVSQSITTSPSPEPAPTPSPTPTPTPPSLPIAQAQKAPAKPVRLLIPKIGVNAKVESVGLDAHGNMAVPSSWESTAWYDMGPRPGDTGNAVIDGHLDSYTGPAVFWHLRDLKPGDKVRVKTSDGATLQFVVTGSKSFPANAFPGKRVFGPASTPQLNLITCSGDWDYHQGQYNQRLVIFTTLVTAK